jgi:hypothetical protein
MSYWGRSSVKEALDAEREFVSGSVIFANGKTFCNRECYKNYLAKHRRAKMKRINNG